jgi:hypothetical protein
MLGWTAGGKTTSRMLPTATTTSKARDRTPVHAEPERNQPSRLQLLLTLPREHPREQGLQVLGVLQLHRLSPLLCALAVAAAQHVAALAVATAAATLSTTSKSATPAPSFQMSMGGQFCLTPLILYSFLHQTLHPASLDCGLCRVTRRLPRTLC